MGWDRRERCPNLIIGAKDDLKDVRGYKIDKGKDEVSSIPLEDLFRLEKAWY